MKVGNDGEEFRIPVQVTNLTNLQPYENMGVKASVTGIDKVVSNLERFGIPVTVPAPF